ncbi:MAG: hypothetical protein JRG95_23210 [Deltaproteobacteria bacterium]|nr:hypothetical protein [Deltaproteobacteria bacterium]
MDELKPDRRALAGLSMVEVMMALTILAGGLLVMLTMQIHAMKGGRHGRNATEAARFAQNQMEVLHHQPFGGLAATGGWTAVVPLTGFVTGGGAAAQAQQYQLDWTIAPFVDPNPALQADTFQFDVRVRWADPNAPAASPLRSYVISSVRYND